MTGIRQPIDDYLAVRRALGYKLEDHEWLLAGRNQRAVPYLYSEDDIAALMAATASLRPALHAATHKTLIGLLAVTGMFSRRTNLDT